MSVSPSKMRIIAETVRYRPLKEDIHILSFTPNKGGVLLRKLLIGLSSYLEKQRLSSSDCFLSRLEVSKGYVLKRNICRAKGTSNKIRKRSSLVFCTVTKKT